MFSRTYLVVAVVLISVLALSACGGGEPLQDATPSVAPLSDTPGPAPTSTTAPPTPHALEPAPSPTPLQISTASPTPSTALNGGPPLADQVSLEPAQEGLPTVEVVKILTPSVVQVVTEFLAMEFSNRPGTPQGRRHGCDPGCAGSHPDQ